MFSWCIINITIYTCTGSILYISQYVYLQAKLGKLCATSNFKWNPDARVYLIVATKNVGNWVHQLLYNIEQIYTATNDDNFDLVLADFESTDISVKDVIRASSFKRCHYIPLQGNFSRSGGLQAALQYINGSDSIVITMDVHLYIPVGFIDSVRKHTVQGKMAYAPVLVRLGEGYSEVNVHGYWELNGYGIYGMYKSDWESIGGFNTTEYRFSWGGEDWDILDKVTAYGIETLRLRYPGFVHYFHTYGGLWGKKNNANFVPDDY